jgi:hypothetical protein
MQFIPLKHPLISTLSMAVGKDKKGITIRNSVDESFLMNMPPESFSTLMVTFAPLFSQRICRNRLDLIDKGLK